jgi:hypothetical protein
MSRNQRPGPAKGYPGRPRRDRRSARRGRAPGRLNSSGVSRLSPAARLSRSTVASRSASEARMSLAGRRPWFRPSLPPAALPPRPPQRRQMLLGGGRHPGYRGGPDGPFPAGPRAAARRPEQARETKQPVNGGGCIGGVWSESLSISAGESTFTRSMGWPVISAIRPKSLSRCSTVSPASSAVAATIRSGIEAARCWPRSASKARTSTARSSMAGVRYSTGIDDSGGRWNPGRNSGPDRAE